MNSMTTNFNASYKRYKKSCKSGTGLVDIPKALRDLDFLQPTGSNILSNYEVFNVSFVYLHLSFILYVHIK